MGGDEWAFRMVTRAYEVLKTTATTVPAARPWEGRGADVAGSGRSDDWSWTSGPRFRGPNGTGFTPDGSAGANGNANGNGSHVDDEPDEAERPSSTSGTTESPRVDSGRIRTVGVELIWTRFDKAEPTRSLSGREEDDVTLSVCMVIAWPPEDLVNRTAEFPAAAETLRTLIDLFERLRRQEAVVAARSRIEDGRFVGWLSYPDVLTAQDAIIDLRETFRTRGLTIKLQTRNGASPSIGTPRRTIHP